MIVLPGIHPLSHQTFSLTSTPVTTDVFNSMRIVAVVSGADALVDFGPNPDVEVNGGGLISTDAPLTFYVAGDWKASVKAASGTGTITFYRAA